MQSVNIDKFYEHVAHFAYVPYTQSKAWIQSTLLQAPHPVACFIDDDIACIGLVRRCLGISWLLIEDECLRSSTIKPAARTTFYRAIIASGYDIVETNNRQIYLPEYEIAMRQAGFLRPIGSFSCQLTNNIPLTQPLSFNENWRRNLRKADANELTLRYVSQPTEQDISDYMQLYSEMTLHKKIGTPFTHESIRILLSSNQFRLYFVEHNHAPISAIVVHTCGQHAGLLYAANSAKANELAAGAFMYRETIQQLAAEGFTSFDMEKLVASTHSTNSVFLFKQGIRGQLTALNGEWSYYRHTWLGIIMFLLKKYYWKARQA